MTTARGAVSPAASPVKQAETSAVAVTRMHAGVPDPEPARSGTRDASTHAQSDSNGDAVFLKPGLVLRIHVDVLGKREVDEPSRRIGEKGEIALPLLGVVKVKDRSIADVADDLQRRYAEYFVNPQVVVEFVTDEKSGGAMPWGHVTVLGRVKKPGRVYIPATRDLKISTAIQEAGGLDTSAKDSAIRITRTGEDGKTRTQEVNLRAVGMRGEVADDLVLRPGDVVYVPELVF